MSAATMTVCSPAESNGGLTSTTSAPTIYIELHFSKYTHSNLSSHGEWSEVHETSSPQSQAYQFPELILATNHQYYTKHRIEDIDVDREINRLLPNSFMNLFNYPARPDSTVSSVCNNTNSSISSLVTYENPISLSCCRSASSKSGERNPTC